MNAVRRDVVYVPLDRLRPQADVKLLTVDLCSNHIMKDAQLSVVYVTQGRDATRIVDVVIDQIVGHNHQVADLKGDPVGHAVQRHAMLAVGVGAADLVVRALSKRVLALRQRGEQLHDLQNIDTRIIIAQEHVGCSGVSKDEQVLRQEDLQRNVLEGVHDIHYNHVIMRGLLTPHPAAHDLPPPHLITRGLPRSHLARIVGGRVQTYQEVQLCLSIDRGDHGCVPIRTANGLS